MKKMNTSPISGMQEFLPATQVTFDNLKKKIGQVYHRHGFLSIETPTIDRCEILLAKAGGDTEKQIYKVIKTAESEDMADQALRFDHTVPLARYVVEHENDLVFPFKVTQIGKNYRGERAQKGRFREFYQCDIDVIGRNSLPLFYDADVIATLLDAYESLGIKTAVKARINNRKIVSGLLEALDLGDKAADVYSVIDHAEKVPAEKTEAALFEIGLSDENVKKLVTFMNLHGERSFVVKNLSNLDLKNPTFEAGVTELDLVMGMLEGAGLGDKIEADMKIVRGLDYYTGTVFEFVLPDYKKLGSIGGGGRYDNLAGYFTDQSLPGVGGSIGLSRLFAVLMENDLIDCQDERPLGYAIIPLSDDEIEYAGRVAKELREDGNRVSVVVMDKKLGDKLAYSAKIAKKGIVIGEDEAKSKKYEIRDFN